MSCSVPSYSKNSTHIGIACGEKPSVWLFHGNQRHSSDLPIDTKTVWHACHNAAKRAGIEKGVHLTRFATVLLPIYSKLVLISEPFRFC